MTWEKLEKALWTWSLSRISCFRDHKHSCIDKSCEQVYILSKQQSFKKQ